MIRQRLGRNETLFQWVESMYVAADVLKKGTDRGNVAALINVMTQSVMTTKATDEMLEARAKKRAENKKEKGGYYDDDAPDYDEVAEQRDRLLERRA